MLKNKLASFAREYTKVKVDQSRFPLGKEHLESIHKLRSNEDIVIMKPDKGVGIVVMNKHDYIAKMIDILNDSSKFEFFGSVEDSDRTGQIERSLQTFCIVCSKTVRLSISEFAQLDLYDQGCMVYRKYINLSQYHSGLFCQ